MPRTGAQRLEENQQRIRKGLAPIIVRTYKGVAYANAVIIKDVLAKLRFSPEKPLLETKIFS